MGEWRNGRRAAFRAQWGLPRGGSNPLSPTKSFLIKIVMLKMNLSKSISLIIGIISFFSFSLFTVLSTAHACSCPEPMSPQAMLEEASAVFSGTVTDVSLILGRNEVKFDVEKIWKGISDKNAVVLTGTGDGDCGFGFKEGKK